MQHKNYSHACPCIFTFLKILCNMLSVYPMIVHEYLIVIHNTFNYTFYTQLKKLKLNLCVLLLEKQISCAESAFRIEQSQDCPDRACLVYFELPTGTTKAEHRIFLFSYVILSWRNLYINKKKSFRDKIYILIFLKISFICEFTSCLARFYCSLLKLLGYIRSCFP
jgi:hypothetical protein